MILIHKALQLIRQTLMFEFLVGAFSLQCSGSPFAVTNQLTRGSLIVNRIPETWFSRHRSFELFHRKPHRHSLLPHLSFAAGVVRRTHHRHIHRIEFVPGHSLSDIVQQGFTRAQFDFVLVVWTLLSHQF